MKSKGDIAILSMLPHWKEDDNENFVRFPKEIEHFGYTPTILNFDKFFLAYENGQAIFYYDEKEFDVKKYKLYILMMAGSPRGHFIIEALQASGACIKNSLQGLRNADKMRTKMLLSHAGIPTIPGCMNFSQFFLGPLLRFFQDEKYVCKLRKGSLGKGVGLLESKMSLISMMELMSSGDITPWQLMFEKFVAEAAGRDIRIIATQEKVVATMERISSGIDFRANICSGGSGTNKKISKEIEGLAIDSIKALGLDYGGVDILETKDGPLVVEVNANPGLKIEDYLGVNVAREIIKHLVGGLK